MTKQTIEQLDAETCINHFRAMRNLSLSESVEKCRLCTKELELSCQDYKPISQYRESIRRGRNAYLVLSNGGLR